MTYILLIFMLNVGKYTSPMDPMGTLSAPKNPTLFTKVKALDPLDSDSLGTWNHSKKGRPKKRQMSTEKKGPKRLFRGFGDDNATPVLMEIIWDYMAPWLLRV